MRKGGVVELAGTWPMGRLMLTAVGVGMDAGSYERDR